MRYVRTERGARRRCACAKTPPRLLYGYSVPGKRDDARLARDGISAAGSGSAEFSRLHAYGTPRARQSAPSTDRTHGRRGRAAASCSWGWACDSPVRRLLCTVAGAGPERAGFRTSDRDPPVPTPHFRVPWSRRYTSRLAVERLEPPPRPARSPRVQAAAQGRARGVPRPCAPCPLAHPKRGGASDLALSRCTPRRRAAFQSFDAAVPQHISRMSSSAVASALRNLHASVSADERQAVMPMLILPSSGA